MPYASRVFLQDSPVTSRGRVALLRRGFEQGTGRKRDIGRAIGQRIEVRGGVVEMLGDEMTRILWQSIREKLIDPYIQFEKLRTYDLSLQNREKTSDQVTIDAAKAVAKEGVGVKCATITPNGDQIAEFQLSQRWSSPNGTLRKYLARRFKGAVIFREGIFAKNIPRTIKHNVIIGRHPEGDIYDAIEESITKGEKVQLIVTSENGDRREIAIRSFDRAPGAVRVEHMDDASIDAFARTCFKFALTNKFPVILGVKDTISKQLDQRYVDRFKTIYKNEFKKEFEKAGIFYAKNLIDAVGAGLLRPNQRDVVLALQNRDGDVMSDIVAEGYGSVAMMVSYLITKDAKTMVAEAAHGTVADQYRKHLEGESTSVNPMALIFAWTSALAHRAKLDNNVALLGFAQEVEAVCIDTIEKGHLTGDLTRAIDGSKKKKRKESEPRQYLTTEQFMEVLGDRLAQRITGKTLEQRMETLIPQGEDASRTSLAA
ncbi:MAG: NADP-dependent isocitrate dehydrogenase [bacterium]